MASSLQRQFNEPLYFPIHRQPPAVNPWNNFSHSSLSGERWRRSSWYDAALKISTRQTCYLPLGHAVQYQTAMTGFGFQVHYRALYRMCLTMALRGTHFIFIDVWSSCFRQWCQTIRLFLLLEAIVRRWCSPLLLTMLVALSKHD